MIQRSIHRLAALALSLVAGVAATATHAAAAPHHPQRIEAVRHLPLGTTVTVCGTVTVPSDAFDPGFAVQQGNAGIYVLDSLGTPRAIGDEVEITGTLVDSFGLLAIQPSSATTLGAGHAVEPRHKKTGQVGEHTEGALLHLRGTMVGDLVDDSPFGFKLDIDDGSGPIQIFLFPGSGISTLGLVAGATIDTACFSNQFETIFECDPPNAGAFTVE